jgi:hypothetical protein
MPERNKLIDTDERLYWPFAVPSPEAQTDEEGQQVRFLEAAFQEGFRPYMCGGDLRASSVTGREAWIIWRGRRRQGGPMQWEVRLFFEDQSFHCLWLDDFAYVADTVLKWLRGHAWADILPSIQARVVKGPSQHDAEGALVDK